MGGGEQDEVLLWIRSRFCSEASLALYPPKYLLANLEATYARTHTFTHAHTCACTTCARTYVRSQPSQMPVRRGGLGTGGRGGGGGRGEGGQFIRKNLMGLLIS